jgi:hypothetical protein
MPTPRANNKGKRIYMPLAAEMGHQKPNFRSLLRFLIC